MNSGQLPDLVECSSDPTFTIISHIFNEEYMLPFWLEYHASIFDNGIIIDYYSTDNSIKIINKICPHWKVIKTVNLNADGSPNFKAELIDKEVNEIEKTIESGYKICLNTTEFFMIPEINKGKLSESFLPSKYYFLKTYMGMNSKLDFYPENITDFFKSIDRINYENNIMRSYRILHSDLYINYGAGRHTCDVNDATNKIIRDDIFILWIGFYPFNKETLKRKLQIQNNIPLYDKEHGLGSQHITNYDSLCNEFNRRITTSSLLSEYDTNISNTIIDAYKFFEKNSHIVYSNLICDYTWGEDMVLLDNDINLLKDSDFDNTGFKIFDLEDYQNVLQTFIKNKILDIIKIDSVPSAISLENYHHYVNEDDHKKILNNMPYKTNDENIVDFCKYIEDFVSESLCTRVKIFNNDIWFRISRPSEKYYNDNNPCHRDVYLDFYRNIVNIYLPIVGSNEKSSLKIQPESHKWNENTTIVTNGGAYFKNIDKKYSVDAIVASKNILSMIRPNPTNNQVMIFSPYLIHGCASNHNEDITRISLEIRFIKDDEPGQKQEKDFRNFLKERTWR